MYKEAYAMMKQAGWWDQFNNFMDQNQYARPLLYGGGGALLGGLLGGDWSSRLLLALLMGGMGAAGGYYHNQLRTPEDRLKSLQGTEKYRKLLQTQKTDATPNSPAKAVEGQPTPEEIAAYNKEYSDQQAMYNSPEYIKAMQEQEAARLKQQAFQRKANQSQAYLSGVPGAKTPDYILAKQTYGPMIANRNNMFIDNSDPANPRLRTPEQVSSIGRPSWQSILRQTTPQDRAKESGMNYYQGPYGPVIRGSSSDYILQHQNDPKFQSRQTAEHNKRINDGFKQHNDAINQLMKKLIDQDHRSASGYRWTMPSRPGAPLIPNIDKYKEQATRKYWKQQRAQLQENARLDAEAAKPQMTLDPYPNSYVEYLRQNNLDATGRPRSRR